MKWIYTFCICFFSSFLLNGQNAKLAIIDFNAKVTIPEDSKEQLKATFEEAAKKQGRFTLVEREQLTEIRSEREKQKSESYLDATILAEQGKAIGADYLLLADITGWQGLVNNVAYNQGSAMVSLQLKFLDTATGEIILSHNQEIWNRSTDQSSSGAAIEAKLMIQVKNYAQSFLLEAFPPILQLLELSKTSKKKVYEVTLGSSSKLNRDMLLEIYEEEKFEVEGETLIRTEKVSSIYVEEMQGEKLVRCIVRDGGKDLLEKHNKGAALKCKIRAWKWRSMFGQVVDAHLVNYELN